MYVLILVLIAIIAVLLTLVVLLQSGRGGGLSGIAGGQTTQILGARQAPDVLEKSTWTLAVVFIVLCVISNFAIDRSERTESVIQQRAREAQPEAVTPGLPPLDEGAAPADEAPGEPIAPIEVPEEQE